MRVWWLLLLVPVASGLTIDDPEGDVERAWGGTAVPVGRDSEYLDAVSLQVEEQIDTVGFALTRAGTSPDAPLVEVQHIDIWFLHGEQGYRIYGYKPDLTPPPIPWEFTLLRADAQGQPLLRLELEDTETLAFDVPRDLLLDERGAPPMPGSQLTGLWAQLESRVRAGPGGPFIEQRTDRLPDTTAATLTFEKGLQQEGAVLTSSEPFRASNGEAGNFTVRMDLRNDGPDQTFTFQVKDLPSGWTVRLPADLDLAAGEQAEVALTMEVPFAHAHGTLAEFIVEAIGDAQSVARLRVGIHYLDVPQPAGHHDRLWIHTQLEGANIVGITQGHRDGQWSTPFMSTLEEDPAHNGGAVAPSTAYSNGGAFETTWTIPLSSLMRIGLDVLDTERAFQMHFDVPVAHDDVVLSGQLALHGEGEPVVVAELHAAADRLEGEVTVDGTVVPVPGLYPYDGPSRLVLELEMRSANVGFESPQTDPYLLPGGFIDLPLAEYSDSVAAADGAVQSAETAAEPTHEPAPTNDAPAPLALWAIALALARKRQ